MVINKFSKDGKRGFSVGSNSLTPEKVAAGAVTALSALVIMLVGGVFRLFVKSSPKAKKVKKKPLWLLAMPIIYKKVKNKIHTDDTKALLSGLVQQYSGGATSVGESAEDEAAEKDFGGVEVIEAVPIASEDEVYQHI